MSRLLTSVSNLSMMSLSSCFFVLQDRPNFLDLETSCSPKRMSSLLIVFSWMVVMLTLTNPFLACLFFSKLFSFCKTKETNEDCDRARNGWSWLKQNRNPVTSVLRNLTLTFKTTGRTYRNERTSSQSSDQSKWQQQHSKNIFILSSRYSHTLTILLNIHSLSSIFVTIIKKWWDMTHTFCNEALV